MSTSSIPTQTWPPLSADRAAPHSVRSTALRPAQDAPRPGSAPWYGLPPVDETAPPGVQVTARVRSRQQHAAEFSRRPLPWLDAALFPETEVA